jgi:hypothetical protein
MSTGARRLALPRTPCAFLEISPQTAHHMFACPPRSDDHSVMGEPPEESRQRSWEVYAGMSGVDSLFSGLSKRTPTGGFFTS